MVELGTLAEAIEALSIPIDSASLREAHRLIDALTAKVAAADIAFDRAQLWNLDGATSMRNWLHTYTKSTSRDAGWAARIAARLASLPLTLTAWSSGALSHGQIQVIVANLNDRRLPHFQAREAGLVASLMSLSVDDTIVAMRQWSEIIDALDPGPEPPAEPERSLYLSRSLEERGELRGSFDPVSSTIVDGALTVGERRDTDTEERRAPSMRRADALVDICRFYLRHHDQPVKRRHRPHVNLIVTLEQLQAGTSGETIDGVTIAHPDIATWVCDSTLHRVLIAGSEVLDYGVAVHSAPAPLFQAVATRDRHCRWPRCDRRARHCDAHHLWHWWHGGPTRIDNLALFCPRHLRNSTTAGTPNSSPTPPSKSPDPKAKPSPATPPEPDHSSTPANPKTSSNHHRWTGPGLAPPTAGSICPSGASFPYDNHEQQALYWPRRPSIRSRNRSA